MRDAMSIDILEAGFFVVFLHFAAKGIQAKLIEIESDKMKGRKTVW